MLSFTVRRHSVTACLLAAAAVTGCTSQSSSKSSKATAAATTSAQQPASGKGGTVVQASLLTPRGGHTATATPQGVVILGGEASQQVVSAAELYQNGKWSPAGALKTARTGHTATLLSSGLILVAGGQSDVVGGQVLATSELYDPASQTSKPGPALITARTGHAAVAFQTAQGEFVLLAGGSDAQGSLNTAELYDVAQDQFVPVAAPLMQDRVGASALKLQDGRILIQGGVTGLMPGSFSSQPAAAELFDPQSQSFSAAPVMSVDRFGSALALNDAGQALVAGGRSLAGPEASLEAFDPLTGSWSSAGNLGQAREGLTATAVAGGGILLVAGSEQAPTATVERLNGAQVSMLTPLNEARMSHTATRLPSGNVLIVGGFDQNGGPVGSSEEYDPSGAGSSGTPGLPSNPGVPIGPTPPPTTTPPPAQAPANILAILPAKGKPGDIITIAGSGFAKSKSDNVVMFQGGAQGKVMFEVRIQRIPVLGSVETLIVEVPTGAQTGDVMVISQGVPSNNAKRFEIDLQSGGKPQVLLTLPRKSRVGGMVTIFGRNFARPASDNIVRFAGAQASLIGGITTQSLPFLGNVSVMLVRVPSGAVTGDLTVEANGKLSDPRAFEIEGTTPAASNPGNPGNPGTPATPGANVYFSEDFEGQTLKFGQQGGLWQASQPAMGPGAAASGSWCAGTAMTAGQVPAGARGYLISREIDLTQATVATLTLKSYVQTDGVDAGRVLISPDQGASYYLVRPQGGYAQSAVFTPAEGFTGASGGWTQKSFDLSAFAGSRVTIVLDFKADGSTQGAGWYVDDVVVSGN